MPVDLAVVEKLLQTVASEDRKVLFEHEVYDLMRAAGAVQIPATRFVPCGAELPDNLLDDFAGPQVVLKIVATGIAHKSDRGGVVFIERDREAVAGAIAEMTGAIDDAKADVRGVLVCEFLPHESASFGNELFVGIRAAREFGPIIAAGLGGVHSEYFAAHIRQGAAVATALAFETSGERFLQMFKQTVAYDILSGQARGYQRLVSDEHLVECFEAFIQLARQFCKNAGRDIPAIKELEVNPFVFRDGYMVPVDGLCHLGELAQIPVLRPINKIGNLLHPKSMAIVGASARGMNVGRVILKNLTESRFDKRHLYAIKEGMTELDGVQCVPDLASLPQKIDTVVVAVQANQVPKIVDEIIDGQLAESVILIPGGMGETEGGKEHERSMARRISQAHEDPDQGPVFLGGNCLGIQSRPGNYDTFFIPRHKLTSRWDAPGRRVALISQSGGYVITRMSNLETLDPDYAISLGNQLDLTVSDFLRYMGDHDLVDVYGVYSEGFKDGDGLAFAHATAALTARGKDVIFYKAGRTQGGKDATTGHTASIAGDYNVCTAAALNAGAMVAGTFKEFEYLVEISARLHDRRVGGTRIGAISNAGYETVGMADAAVGPHYEVSLPPLSDHTKASLDVIIARHKIEGLVNVRNPLDVTPMATDECHEECIRCMLECDSIDAVVASFVPMTPAMQTTPEEMSISAHSSMAYRLPKIYADTDKPIVVVIDAGPIFDPLARRIRQSGIPVFRSADSAVRSLGRYLYHRVQRQNTQRREKTRADAALSHT